ncbi:MAG: hypothetical protein Q7W02_24395 [Candidatus Rokubacteria bacterium]|nr:hypothetical protein [Candidatus Rokubacteria bacterium]
MDFLVVYDGDAPVAILPLRRRKRHLFGVSAMVLESPHGHHMKLADLVFAKTPENAAILSEVIAHLRQAPTQWDAIHLARLLDDSSALYAFQSYPPALSIMRP